MGYYPILVDLTGRRCVVVGGGQVAERKVDGLLAAGAAVTVVSPTLTERLQGWRNAGKIVWRDRGYRENDLDGFEIAFVATSQPEINAAVAREARERRVWVNAADDPAHCDFILPAVLRRGELLVTVATGGSSPALARAIREQLADYFDENYAALSRIVADARKELRAAGQNPAPEAWRGAINAEFRRLVTDKFYEKARAYLLERLGVS